MGVLPDANHIHLKNLVVERKIDKMSPKLIDVFCP